MSDSFLVAARIPMGREAFERWLDTPSPGAGAFADPDAMFDGWYWDGRRSGEQWQETEVTPREFFGEQVERSCEGDPLQVVLRHRDDALEAYLFHFGYDEYSVHTALPLLAAAGRLADGPGEFPVLFWAETSGALRAPDWDGWLSVLLVGREGARFSGPLDLTAAVAALRPAQDAFYELIGRVARDEGAWDGRPPFRTDAPRDPAFTDPALSH